MKEQKKNIFNADPDQELEYMEQVSQPKETGAAANKESAAPSAGAPANQSQRELLKALQGKGEKTECFGGVLLQREGVLSFVIKGMTDEEREETRKAYQSIYSTNLRGLIGRADPFVESFDEYTVFNFERVNGSKSFRQICREKQGDGKTGVFAKLVAILTKLHNHYVHSGRYQSLNCLSLDTLFEDEIGQYWLLPLRAFGNCYPKEIAPEVRTANSGDARSDLFGAAYVAVEMACNDEVPEMYHLQDGMISQCLNGLPACRPSLKTVAKAYKSAATRQPNTAEAVETEEDDREQSFVDPRFLHAIKAFFLKIWKWLQGFLMSEPAAQRNGTKKPGAFRKAKPIAVDEEEEWEDCL